jgi:hypothetical protein
MTSCCSARSCEHTQNTQGPLHESALLCRSYCSAVCDLTGWFCIGSCLVVCLMLLPVTPRPSLC